MNYHGEIQCKRVFQWCLARYGDKDDETSFEFQAAQMQNYMPRYYTGNKVITGDHVARFYSACLCRMNHGGRSIEQIFPTGEMMEAVLYR